MTRISWLTRYPTLNEPAPSVRVVAALSRSHAPNRPASTASAPQGATSKSSEGGKPSPRTRMTWPSVRSVVGPIRTPSGGFRSVAGVGRVDVSVSRVTSRSATPPSTVSTPKSRGTRDRSKNASIAAVARPLSACLYDRSRVHPAPPGRPCRPARSRRADLPRQRRGSRRFSQAAMVGDPRRRYRTRRIERRHGPARAVRGDWYHRHRDGAVHLDPTRPSSSSAAITSIPASASMSPGAMEASITPSTSRRWKRPPSWAPAGGRSTSCWRHRSRCCLLACANTYPRSSRASSRRYRSTSARYPSTNRFWQQLTTAGGIVCCQKRWGWALGTRRCGRGGPTKQVRRPGQRAPPGLAQGAGRPSSGWCSRRGRRLRGRKATGPRRGCCR